MAIKLLGYHSFSFTKVGSLSCLKTTFLRQFLKQLKYPCIALNLKWLVLHQCWLDRNCFQKCIHIFEVVVKSNQMSIKKILWVTYVSSVLDQRSPTTIRIIGSDLSETLNSCLYILLYEFPELIYHKHPHHRIVYIVKHLHPIA